MRDFDEAKKYIASDNMTPRLFDDDCSNGCKDKIMHIEWVLLEKDKGCIELVTSEE